MRSFECVLLLDQIFRKQCTVRQYTTLIYLINMLGEISVRIGVRLKSCTILAFLRRIRKMSTLSSANVTDVNLLLKERTHMRLCLNMLIFTHNLGNWLIVILPNLFVGTPRICIFIFLLIVWVHSFSKLISSMKLYFAEDKVLVFVILREKNAKIVQL